MLQSRLGIFVAAFLSFANSPYSIYPSFLLSESCRAEAFLTPPPPPTMHPSILSLHSLTNRQYYRNNYT
jgi:hypothetical protein